MRRRTNEERSRSTRRALTSAARQRFESNGYARTSLDQIAELAGVTKGALYHHFPTKRALYEAVVMEIHDEIHAQASRRYRKGDDTWDRFVEVFAAFVEEAAEPSLQLMMLEAPAVLGYERWREIGDKRHVPGILEMLEDLQAEADLVFDASPELARVLNTMVNALATLVSQADDPPTVRTVVIPVWAHFLHSLRVEPRRQAGQP